MSTTTKHFGSAMETFRLCRASQEEMPSNHRSPTEAVGHVCLFFVWNINVHV